MKKLFSKLLLVLLASGIGSGFGQTWTTVAGGIYAQVSRHAIYEGELYVSAGANKSTIKKLDADSWVDVGSPFTTVIKGLQVLDGNLYAISSLEDPDGPGESKLYALEDGAWKIKAKYAGLTEDMFVYDGKIGIMINVSADKGIVVLWDGTEWTNIGTFNGRVFQTQVWNDQLMCFGMFSKVDGTAAAAAASWDGTTWSQGGSRLDLWCGGLNWGVATTVHEGDLYVSDECIDGVNEVKREAAPVYSWDGTEWTDTKLEGPAVPYKMVSHKWSILGLPYGNRGKSVYTFNGTEWSETSVERGEVDTMLLDEVFVFKGELYAIGSIYNKSFGLLGVIKIDVLPNSLGETATAHFAAYPNPAQHQVTINTALEGSFDYRLVNVQGQLCQVGTLANNDAIELQELPRGIYFLHLTGSENSSQTVLKVLKE